MLTAGQSQPKPGQDDLIAQCLCYDWTTILDIGAGSGWVAERFLKAGRRPFTTFALLPNQDIPDFGLVLIERMDKIDSASMDAIWASHVLEHSHNTGLALSEMHRILQPQGWLFLSVPPFKHAVVGGHVNIGWNLGVLAYVLALHGFDCRRGAFIRHGYNLAAFVQKAALPDVGLTHGRGDLETLAEYLPQTYRLVQNSNGDVDAINWVWRIAPALNAKSLRNQLRRKIGKIAGRFL